MKHGYRESSFRGFFLGIFRRTVKVTDMATYINEGAGAQLFNEVDHVQTWITVKSVVRNHNDSGKSGMDSLLITFDCSNITSRTYHIYAISCPRSKDDV